MHCLYLSFSQSLLTVSASLYLGFQGVDRLDQALNSTCGEEFRGEDLKDNTAIETAVDQQPDKLLPWNSVIHQWMVIVAANVMAVDVADTRQKLCRWIERNTVASVIQVRVPKIPTCPDLTSRDDLQQLVVGVADPHNWFFRIGADLQFCNKTDLRRIATAPLMRP